jgi:hypothetical protein
MQGKFETNFSQYDDPKSKEYPGKWDKIKLIDNRRNVIYQSKSTVTSNKLVPATSIT